MPPLLSSSDSEDDADVPKESFRINESYAKRLEHNKAREERHRLQAKYGDQVLEHKPNDEDDEEEDPSTSESEDELGELVTPQLDAEIWRTIAMIRERRPEVYDDSWKGFSEDTAEPIQREKKEKVNTLKDIADNSRCT
jgi:protein KRI1